MTVLKELRQKNSTYISSTYTQFTSTVYKGILYYNKGKVNDCKMLETP